MTSHASPQTEPALQSIVGPSNASLHADQDPEEDVEREATELRVISHVSHTTATRTNNNALQRFWRSNVKLSVPHAACRDHLANERTFLGYLRTSAALSILGIFLLQLYRLQHAPNPSAVFGYYVLSKPMALMLQTLALGVCLVGAIRFFRQQHALSVGKVYAGGWEVLVVGGGVLMTLLAIFVLHVAVDIYKDKH